MVSRVVAVIVVAVVALAGAAAALAAERPNLFVTHVSNPPANAEPGDSFDVSGTVANRGRRGASGRVYAQLRGAGKRFGLGSSQPVAVPARASSPFALQATIPGGVRRDVAANGGSKRYWLVACVQRRGDAGRLRCRAARERITVSLPPDFQPGARTLDDPLFPQVGNGGYDARHYEIELDYDPDANAFNSARLTMEAIATQDLSEFSLDFQRFDVASVRVNGEEAQFAYADTPPLEGGGTQPLKLVVTPAQGLPDGEAFTVVVSYSGEPDIFVDPDTSWEGWIPACYDDGGTEVCDGAFVVNEPLGAQSWVPLNNYPTDKATFDTSISVPRDRRAVGIGELVGGAPVVDGGTWTWSWSEDDPTAPYLITATSGDFSYEVVGIVEELTGRVLPQYNFIDSTATPDQRAQIEAALARTKEMIDFLGRRFGPYPFDSGGAVADRAANVCYALEVQTKSHYAGSCPAGDPRVSQSTLLHEIAHQWFGNSVTLERWTDIWFNEGWAEWSTWAWTYADGTSTSSPAQRFWSEYNSTSNPGRWETAPAVLDGDPANLFAHFPTYVRGAMTLEGYRQIVGAARFFDFARMLQRDYAYGNIGTREFIAEAVAFSGFEGERRELLEEYFEQWLFGESKPTITPESFT